MCFSVCVISGKWSLNKNRPNYVFIRGLHRRKYHRGTGRLNTGIVVEKRDSLEVVEPTQIMVSKMINKNITWSDVVQDSIAQGVHTGLQYTQVQ